MRWVHEHIVENVAAEFCMLACLRPDEWSAGEYEIFDAAPSVPFGHAWTVNVDLYSDHDESICLSFKLDLKPGEDEPRPYDFTVAVF